MYDKIAVTMNRDYGCNDIAAEDVESYLRFQDMTYISDEEAGIIEDLLEQFI